MLVDESLDYLQATMGTLKGERSVSSLIHCNCGYKQIVDTRKLTICSTHTFWVTLMFLSEILDSLQVSVFVGQREWGVTSLVECTCIYEVMQQLMCHMYFYIYIGSQRCLFTRHLIVFKLPLAQARESGVSPPALLTVRTGTYTTCIGSL